MIGFRRMHLFKSVHGACKKSGKLKHRYIIKQNITALKWRFIYSHKQITNV